jgi:hypothetical protein
MREFGVRFERTPLLYDNTSAISVAENRVLHKRMRHLERFERALPMYDNTSVISIAENLVFHKRMRHLERRQLPERSRREGRYWDEIHRHREIVGQYLHQTF